MGLYFVNLTDSIRNRMVGEMNLDINHPDNDRFYMSRRLTEEGVIQWPPLLAEAATSYSDDWLASQLVQRGFLKTYETTVRGRKRVPRKAHETLAEGEFNAYYIRAVCLEAIENGNGFVEVYRAKDVASRRRPVVADVGTVLMAEALLDELRQPATERVTVGLPNSGRSVKLTSRVN